MTTDIVLADTSNAMLALIQRAATDETFSVEKLEHLLAVKERWDKEIARKEYVAALAEFKADPPQIIKDKRVSYGNTNYRHATLGQVADAVAAGLARHGLSHSWSVSQEQGKVTVTCTLTHAAGHSESVSIKGPQDDSGQKNGIQQIGSAITYLERYTLMAITGLAASDMDDDGQSAGQRPSHRVERVTAPSSSDSPPYGFCEWHETYFTGRTRQGNAYHRAGPHFCNGESIVSKTGETIVEREADQIPDLPPDEGVEPNPDSDAEMCTSCELHPALPNGAYCQACEQDLFGDQQGRMMDAPQELAH